ncbi:MAG: hypothetical protein PGN11_06335 [Quadrisphaera sp.]
MPSCRTRAPRRSPTSTSFPRGRCGACACGPGTGGRGIAHHLLDGAARYAFEQGAPAVEGYPVDNRGEKVDLTMAFVGTKALFEGAGFTVASPTESKAGGFPRVLVRRYP